MTTATQNTEWLREPMEDWQNAGRALPHGAMTIGKSRIALATNGAILVAVYTDDPEIPKLNYAGSEPENGQLAQLFAILSARSEGSELIPFSQLKAWAGEVQPEFVQCEACKDEDDTAECGIECPHCDGSGQVDNQACFRPGHLLGVRVNRQQLALGVQHLECASGVVRIGHFTSGPDRSPGLLIDATQVWRLAIMGMRPGDNDEAEPRFEAIQ